MAKEYIDREAIIADMKKRYCTGCNSYNGVRCRACWVDDAVGEIDDAPAADVAPVVHARWIKEGGDMHYSGHMIFCSKCGKRHFVFGKHYFSFSCLELCTEPNYCPNCGAKMDGGVGNG